MAQPIAVPTKNPGEVFIPALGRAFQQVELREDDIYDTVEQASGAIAADTSLKLFQSVTDKNEQHTSLQQVRRLPAGDEAAIFRVGVHTRGSVGNTVPIFNDHKKLLENGVLALKFNRRQIVTGPLLRFQSGYGIAGYSVENGTSAVSVGVPSAAAAPTLFVPQQLRDNDDLNGEILFPNAAWVTNYAVPTLTGYAWITVFLHAVIKSPLGK